MDILERLSGKGELLYQYVRGSHLYGLNTPTSDVDTGGIFISDISGILGLRQRYKQQIEDSKCDNVLFEVGRYCELLIKSNPTVMEALFVPEDKMIVKPNPVLMPLFKNRNKFLTKYCFRSFIAYADGQIQKARGLNKKINQPPMERKTVFDFCYTFKEQGSTPLKYWLEYRNLDEKYCGLVSLPNMHDVYGVYYDWGHYFQDHEITMDKFIQELGEHEDREYISLPDVVEKYKNAKNDEEKSKYAKLIDIAHKDNMFDFLSNQYGIDGDTEGDKVEWWFEMNSHPIGYAGILAEDGTSVKLSSVAKGEKPICYMTFNKDGFRKHCADYKSYKEWEKNRNPIRYESNLHQNYDSKNMCHCMRLMNMGLEIAEGKGMILNRAEAGDRDFLMKIRNHEIEYKDLMHIAEEKKKQMEMAAANSTIPNNIDADFVNDILIDMRKKYYSFN